MEKGNFMMKVSLVMFLLIFIPLASATISIDPLPSLYNVGDDLNAKVTLGKPVTTYDFLLVKLVCGTSTLELYRAPLQVTANEQKIISIPITLNRLVIQDLRGECSLSAEYHGEKIASSLFEITNEVNVVMTLPAVKVVPGNSLGVSGSAVKRNGKNLEGTAEIEISGVDFRTTAPVKNGVFNATITLPPTTPARTYSLTVSAFESDSEGLHINEGSMTQSFRVPQVPTSIDIALSGQSAYPGMEFTYAVFLTDQAREPMDGDARVVLSNPRGNTYTEEMISLGETHSWIVPSNSTPGTWSLSAKSANLDQRKTIAIPEVMNASFTLQNRTLFITNTGNVRYTKSVAVSIGENDEFVDADIAVGDVRKYRLVAPPGDYPIEVKESESQTHELGNAFLTGNSVGVRDADALFGNSPWALWFVSIVIAASVALYFYRRIAKRAYWGRTPKSIEPERVSRTLTVGNMVSHEKPGKETCSVLSFYIKNLSQLESANDHSALDAVSAIVASASGRSAAIYNQGMHKVMIFSPRKHPAPAIAALSLAREIEQKLNDYNKRYALKISFGLGVSQGDMIVEDHGGAFKFTAVGNTVTSAKHMAEQSPSAVLINSEVHRATIGKVKADRVSDKYWRVSAMGNRGANSEFIKRFKQRNS